MEENELWNKLRQGQHEALELIYRQYFSDLYSYGKKFSSDIATVEDCIQEMFIELWRNCSNLSATNAIKPYLFVALRRKIIRHVKQHRKITDTEIKEYHFDAELAIDEVIVEGELKYEKSEKLKHAYNQLSDRQKEIVYLKFYANLGYDEISDIMDLNYQSARNLLSRAVAKLGKTMLLIILLVIFCLG